MKWAEKLRWREEITQKYFDHQTFSSKENQLNKRSGLTPDESLIWFKQKIFFIPQMFFVYSCLSEGWTWVGIQIAPSPPPSTSSGLSRTNSIPFGSILNSCSSWGIFWPHSCLCKKEWFNYKSSHSCDRYSDCGLWKEYFTFCKKVYSVA